MKNTFGTIGLGLAGAVAAVGLMSAGVQTAQAQFAISVAPSNPSSPVITSDGSGGWNWTYYLTLNGATESAPAGTSFYFALSSNSGYKSFTFNLTGGLGNIYSGTPSSNTPVQSGTGAWNIYEDQSAAYAEAVYEGSTPLSSGSIGNYVIDTSTLGGTTATHTTFGQTSSTSVGVVSGGFDNFASALGTNIELQSVVVPLIGGTPESPLPLPAAFWPGLLTLGGMAVVGGLGLRRRTL